MMPEMTTAADEAAAYVNALADAYLDGWTRHRPDLAVYLGVPLERHDGLPDNSLDGVRAWQAREDAWAAELDRIGPAALAGRPERVTHGILREELDAARRLRVCRKELWTVDAVGGWLGGYPFVAETQPVGTDELRRQALERWSGFAAFIANEIEKLREGVRLGYTAPRDGVRLVIGQAEAMLAGSAADSPFFDPARRDGSPAFRREWEALVAGSINPALARCRDYLRDEYLPAARETLSIAAGPAGAAGYRASLRAYSTLELDPDEVHRTGMEELARAEDEIRPLAARLLGTDDLAAVLAGLRAAPGLMFRDGDEMLARARAAVDRAREAAPRWFARLPTADVAVEPCPAYQQATAPGGVYVPPAADGSRPGTYVLNTFRAAETSRLPAERIAFHETVPGHHLQLALGQERAGAHPLARCFGNSGFVEGWATYAEDLADEMGLYSSEPARLGWLFGRAFYAATAVTDTGIHHLGWTRERARDYLRAHTLVTPARADSVIDLQVAWPGQAVCYLVGCREIRRLRERAAAALGADFDPRAFHARVLEDGSVTLPMLREKVERWMARESASFPALDAATAFTAR